MYATAQDMIDRFGETEVIRLTNPEDRAATVIDADNLAVKLADAASTIDTYLRGHYALPVLADPLPGALVRAACVLARYDLAKSDRSDPSEQMAKDRAEVIRWLEKVAANQVALPIARANQTGAPTSGPGARFSDRKPAFSGDQLKGW